MITQVSILALVTWIFTQIIKKRVRLTAEEVALSIAVVTTGIALAAGLIALNINAALIAIVAYLGASIGHDKLYKPALNK